MKSPAASSSSSRKKHTDRAWTEEEDQKLLHCIQTHGHASWRTLPKKAGLDRSWKSCRARWSDHLRPDLKRESFGEDEEDLIIKLHALLGNRWSLIAGRLPGRTDVEVQNYWNSHIKAKLTNMGIDPQNHRPRQHHLVQSKSKQICDDDDQDDNATANSDGDGDDDEDDDDDENVAASDAGSNS